MGLKGISQTLGFKLRNVPELPSTASTSRKSAPSIGVPLTSRFITPTLSSPEVNSALEQRQATLAIHFQDEDKLSKLMAGSDSAAVSTSPISLSTQT